MTEWKSLHALLEVAQWKWIPLCLSSSTGTFNQDSSNGKTLMMLAMNIINFSSLEWSISLQSTLYIKNLVEKKYVMINYFK